MLAGVPDDAELADALDRALAVGGAGWRARMLATVPSNIKNPQWLADQAVALADETGLRVTVWDVDELEADGFGGILGIGQASATPPRLIQLEYTPAQGRAEGTARRPGRQGHHLRHRRPLHQARRGRWST